MKLKPSAKDLMTIIEEAMALVIGGEDQGE